MSTMANAAPVGILLLLAMVAMMNCRDENGSFSTAGVTATRPVSTSQAALLDRPLPPAASQYVELRERMVAEQIAHPRDDREPVTDERVLEAIRLVPRHVFATGNPPQAAYADMPLPIGHSQTISQPYIVALMTELLELTPESKVLEIGTGSGYQAAVLAHLTPHVYTIEIVEPLGRQAMRILAEQGYDQVHCRIGDGYAGWPEAAPFDAIIVTCAADDIPKPLWEQLKCGGRVVIPLSGYWGGQDLVVVTKGPDGKRQKQSVTSVRFVPMTGKAGEN